MPNAAGTIALIEQVAKAKGVPVTLQKVEELRDITGYGVPSCDKIEQWLVA